MPIGAAVAAHAATAKRIEAPTPVLKPFQIRVIEEKERLDAWVDKTADFLASPACKAVSALERARMRTQLRLMCELSTVLGARIAAFTSPSQPA